jgi:hypothetical protein
MKLAMLTSAGLSMVAAAAFAWQSATAPVTEKSETPRSCCAKKSADAPMKCERPAATTGDSAKHAGHEGHSKMRCSLTGTVVDTCCCVEREGKTHCTLADKDVAECCCTPVEDEKSASARTN